MYKRVIFKLSGEALANNKANTPFDNEYITNLVNELAEIKKSGVDVSVVIGGGNIWRGNMGEFLEDDSRSHQIGMLATIQSSIFLQAVFKKQGIDAEVFTPFTISSFTSLYSVPACEECFKKGKVAIFAGGLGHPYFSTDTVTALRAIELKADGIFYTKNGVDGVYDKDPKKYADAKKYNEITIVEALQNHDIKVMDKAALALLLENKKDFQVIGLTKGNLLNAVKGLTKGTILKHNNET